MSSEVKTLKEESEIKTKIKAVVLLSGGLDSAIAAKLLVDQGIDVIGLNFHSPFCICNSKAQSFECSAVLFAQKIGIPCKMIQKGDEYLELVKHPRFGYGKNINPCIDCRIHILKESKNYADQIGAKFIITGEVLGQRPKSQTMNAMKLIEKESGLEGLLLRPLSAGLLPETIPEKEGWVDRQKLLAIQGRQRNVQVELGQKYELIRQYCAGGGCLLTDQHFAAKVRDYLQYNNPPKMDDMRFLKLGRHFRINNVKIIVGRDETENKSLSSWARASDVVIDLKGLKCPTTLIEAPKTQEDLNFAAQLTLYYSDGESRTAEVTVKDPKNQFHDFTISRDSSIEAEKMQIL